MKKRNILFFVFVLLISCFGLGGCGSPEKDGSDDVIVLRVSNWEEYMDEGDWDAEEVIELENGEEIIGVNPLIEDFETWYYETYGVKVEVEYSTFGTNEDLYNQLTLGDEYDLVCPSDYLIMKLMAEGKLTPYSDEFFDETDENNYYVRGVSDYINGVFDNNEINGEPWSKYAAGYMWGTTGIIYNPEFISEEQASSWELFTDKSLERNITIKDNVRDSMFAAMAIYKRDIITDPEFMASVDYNDRLKEILNDTSEDAVQGCEEILKDMKDLAYSFETDSGKADMVTGKVFANYQWSGDAVYSMDQAEEDGLYLEYSVPLECSNLWFDGWVMLSDGINGDSSKQHAAESFVNFLSRPDNAVRNMYYIGYTSVISGGDDDTVLQYVDWCYSAEEDAEEIVDYDLSYFFGDEEAVITCEAEQTKRQLYAQYPTEEVINRCVIMWYFNDEENARINQMWINVRCFDMSKAVVPLVTLAIVIVVIVILALIYLQRHRVFNIKKRN
ncbi:MAG: extracellular solute-binding protein [Lachnospiraceae bacterium]